ncbi:hypothetical protein VPH47_04350 [Stenotrophomonas sp. WED208]|uniref:hypothetical protein n=1 Tax=Stenotrophomonas sp. WED208 TaxID=3112800 RepID=UPI0034D6AB82
MQWIASGVLFRLLVLSVILACAALPSVANAQDLKKNLQFRASCQGGACARFAGGKNAAWGYNSESLPTEQAARDRAVKDYLLLAGWDRQQSAGSAWWTHCGTADITNQDVTYYSYPQTWYGSVTFTHTCYSYRPDGLSPPGATHKDVQVAAIVASCKPGFTVKDYSTGECWRRPNDCASYPENKDFGCGKSIAELEATTPPSSAPTHPFHVQQTCIARESCELRCQMDNCKWMDTVIPGFVRPYLDQDGFWPNIEAMCNVTMAALRLKSGGTWIGKQQCFALMGWYHVRTDLRNSLVVHGCGTKQDWDLVGSKIEPCLRETQPGLPQPYYEFGSVVITAVREEVRSLCLAERETSGLPTPINNDLKGKVCEVGP